MSSGLVVGVDLDGVLADFNSAFIEKVIEVTGKDLFPPRPFNIPTWNYPEFYGYSHEEVSAVWKAIKISHDFWVKLEPYNETRIFLEELSYLDVEVYFVTARPGLRTKLQTEVWLELMGYPKPTVLVAGDKAPICAALGVNYYIDDKNENCSEVWQYSGGTNMFMLAQPWNQAIAHIPRINSIMDFITAVRQALEE